MSQLTISTRVAVGMLAMFLCGSLGVVVALAAMSNAMKAAQATSQSYVPVMQASQEFEREILTARVNFIYYALIQKPGALEEARVHYQKARAAAAFLSSMTSNSNELAAFRPTISTLNQQLALYDAAL